MIKVIRSAWKVTPDDAARLLVPAILMPLIYILPYQLMPTQGLARTVFSLCVGLLGMYLGLAVQTKRRAAGCKIDNTGYAIGVCAAGSAIAAIGSLLVLEEPTMTWRVITAGTQGTVVLGWLALWRVSKPWLSRSLARAAFFAAAAGFVLYILGNFGLPDPVTVSPWTWGWTEPRGVIARTLELPLEPALGAALLLAVAIYWRRHVLRQHGYSRRHGSP